MPFKILVADDNINDKTDEIFQASRDVAGGRL